MSDIVMHVDGFELHADDRDDEPRIRDLDIAERAGMTRARDIRPLVKKSLANGLLLAADLRELSSRKSIPGKNGSFRSVELTEYLLTETGALKLLTRIETPKARELVGLMVQVFRKAIRQLQVTPQSVPVLAEVVHGARMGDSYEMRSQMQALCVMTARAAQISIRKVHGLLRRTYRVPSPYYLGLLSWPSAQSLLLDLSLGRITLGPPRLRLVKNNVRQLGLWGATQ